MKTSELMIRCLAMREEQHWVAICLPFDLAAQGETLEEAKAGLDGQIRSYLRDALVGQDREHAEYLLNRQAPLKYWAMYAIAAVCEHVKNRAKWMRFSTPVPLEPAHA